MAAFPEVAEPTPKAPRKKRSAFPEVDEPLLGEESSGPADAGILKSLGAIPEVLGRTAIHSSTAGWEAAQDVELAKAGDVDAAARANARGYLASSLGALIPGGPALQGIRAVGPLAARAGLGALGGGVSAGLEAGASGKEIVPAVGYGAALAGLLGPASGLAQGFLARRAAERLVKSGKPVPADIAKKVVEEVSEAVEGPSQDPVKRVIKALEEVPDLRGKQEVLFRAERGKRIRQFKRAGEEIGGEAGARAQMRTLAGELPKVEFGSLRPLIDQSDVDSIFNIVKQSPMLGEWERPRAVSALLSLFEPGGFKLPTRSELTVLEKALGTEFVETLIKKQPELTKWKRLGMELLSAPRTLQASFDLSAPLRQGLFLGAGHPKEFASAFNGMLTGLGTKRGAEALEMAIAQDPMSELAHQSGLAITKAGSAVGRQEEVFAGNLLRKIAPIGFSERAYTGFLNKLRFDVFKSMVKDAQRSGVDLNNVDSMRKIASFVNAASGRGDLPKSIARHAESLNAVLFSPRLMASRLQTLNPALYIRSDPTVRKHALRSLLSLGSIASTAVGISKLAGADVETDMTSPDWGKIKVGSTRYDILGGYQQYLRLGARIAKGFAEGEGASEKTTKAFQPSLSFIRNKLAPIPGLLADLVSGKDFKGDPFDLPIALRERFTPMILQDVWEAVQEWGWYGIPVAAPSVFGVAVQTYED